MKEKTQTETWFAKCADCINHSGGDDRCPLIFPILGGRCPWSRDEAKRRKEIPLTRNEITGLRRKVI